LERKNADLKDWKNEWEIIWEKSDIL
jgi:hypothetical protein